MTKYFILFAALVILAVQCQKAKAESVCVEYENVEIKECTSTRGRNAIGGAVLGGLGGYLLGGKRAAGWGAGGGALLGAASGDKKCTTKVEKHCVKYQEIVRK
jgi:uncharacterized protein YcfJ